MGKKTVAAAPFRVGEWLPSDQAVLDKWLKSLINEVKKKPKPLHPVMVEFKVLIETDPEVFIFFNQMFDQVPHKPPYNQSPTHKPQVRNYEQMLQLINAILTKTPTFNETGLVGFPINAILDWSMGTVGGFAGFLNDKVNAMFKKVLNEWAIFLDSKDSCYVLNSQLPTHWFSKPALKALAEADPFYGKDPNDPKDPKENFIYNFQCDPDKPHWGYTSWDDFFIRSFNKGRRPVASPDDDSIIANACESAPYRIAHNVKLRDKFWIKAQPYSIEHMLASDVLTEQFVGGTIYQAFLSAKSYHRWHSPVSGKILKTRIIDGSYYSETLAEGFDPSGPNESQAYITEVATRGLIFIEADNPDIGLMCFIAVGMAEVSTCQITVYEGQQVKKGEQLGTFHFGGSTHCLIFRPEIKLKFDLHGQKPGLNSSNIPINSRIATVLKKSGRKK